MTLQALYTSQFGQLLRDWRQHRRLSQLALSSRCGISQRHISFLETGRSRPSRPTIIALSEALDIPLRERNALLERSGFAPTYGEAALADHSVALFREALELALLHHEPYPALVLDGRWNMIMANQAALRFFSQFIDMTAALEAMGSPENFQIVRLCLDDRGFKPFIVNWEDVVYSYLQRARRALLHNPGDQPLADLVTEILETPGAPARWRMPDSTTPPAPAVSVVVQNGTARYSLFTMLAHFGAPQDVTVEELSVETFYPADEMTKARLLALAPDATPPRQRTDAARC